MSSILVPLTVALLVQVAPPTWQSSYEQGLALMKDGNHQAAHRQFERALADRPEEGLSVPTGEVHSLDYIPHLYLAITAYHAGQLGLARAHLAEADASGVAANSRFGGPLLEHYRDLIASAPVIPSESTSPPEGIDLAKVRSPARHPEVLADDEIRQLRRETAIRCGLGSQTDASSAPWYYHYELGLELARRGDPQRALDALLAAAERKPLPKDYARMYGMWFIRYHPYLELADSHAALGNWRCAFNALQISEQAGEVQSDDDETFARFRSLLEKCRDKLGDEAE
jgi:tetratricopeptide (TPR) repeat protein